MQVHFTRVSTPSSFRAGAAAGVEPAADGRGITVAAGASGSWTGPWVAPAFGIEELVASWNADAPPGALVEVEVQGRLPGHETRWYALARWTYADDRRRRASVPGQADADAAVEVDTLVARTPLRAYRLRVTLTAPAAPPTLRLVAAAASAGRADGEIASLPGTACGVELGVPAYAQSVHAGRYPELGGGGEAWCSPTSTAMVLAYWGSGPAPPDYAWVDPDIPDPWVVHAARHTFDHAYGGTGNWAFNTAYAAHFGLDAFVTRLRSLREAERFVREGIPLVASIAAAAGELDGFPLARGTAGHLVVVTGFAADGSPIVNDPAAESNATVRRIYDRQQFERAWIGGSGGVVYVISPPGKALPPSGGSW